MDTIEKIEPHDLFRAKIRPILNWHEWLEIWQAASSFQERLGLLHVGFDISMKSPPKWNMPEYDELDRLKFYLKIADGWDSKSFFALPEDEGKWYLMGYDANYNPIQREPRDLRRELAHKAHDLLCLNFFRINPHRAQSEIHRRWEAIVSSEDFFSMIQKFFRAEPVRFSESFQIRNLSRNEKSHNTQLVSEFLLSLGGFLWAWEEKPVGSWTGNHKADEELNRKTRERIDSSKPWMIEILSFLGELDLLRRWAKKLDRPCEDKLIEIALREEFVNYMHPVLENRRAETLDEACYLGSSAGWLLKYFELKKREHKRLEAIRTSEITIKEEGLKIKKLAKK